MTDDAISRGIVRSSLPGKERDLCAEESGVLLKSIVPQIQDTSRVIEEITTVNEEMNSGANQVSSAINMLNQVTQKNASASEKMATSVEKLSSQAEHLEKIVAFFKLRKS